MSLLTDIEWDTYLLFMEDYQALLRKKEKRSRTIIQGILNKNDFYSKENKDKIILNSIERQKRGHNIFTNRIRSNRDYKDLQDEELDFLESIAKTNWYKHGRKIFELQSKSILTPYEFDKLPPKLQGDYEKEIINKPFGRNMYGQKTPPYTITQYVKKASGGRRSMKNKKRTRKLRR